MERQDRGLVIPVLLGAALAMLINNKRDTVSVLIGLVSGVAAAFYLAPHFVSYFNFPPDITAFGIGAASDKICRTIYKRFNKDWENPVDLILINSPVSETQEVLHQTSKLNEQINIYPDSSRPEDGHWTDGLHTPLR